MKLIKKFHVGLLSVIAGATRLSSLGQVESRAAGLKSIEPFEEARQAAKQTGKPLLVFIGDMSACKDCQAFTNSVCMQQAFIEFASTNLI